VILSPSFFEKDWPREELNGLFSLELGGPHRILPVWHQVDHADVKRYSAILGARHAAKSTEGIDKVIEKIAAAIRAREGQEIK